MLYLCGMSLWCFWDMWVLVYNRVKMLRPICGLHVFGVLSGIEVLCEGK